MIDKLSDCTCICIATNFTKKIDMKVALCISTLTGIYTCF